MRITDKDLQKSVSPTKGKAATPNQAQFRNKDTGTFFYDEDGQKQTTLPEDKITAKSYIKDNSSDFFVKVNQNNQIYNPTDSLYLQDSLRSARQQGMATTPYKFIRITLEGFDYYLSFLRTKNSAFLKQAERGLR
jgi:hypothetical protein